MHKPDVALPPGAPRRPLADVTTAFREHPGETLCGSVGISPASLCSERRPGCWSHLTLSALNGQLEHANIRLPERLDRWLRLLFRRRTCTRCIFRHQPETDSNYSNLLDLGPASRTYNHGPRFAELVLRARCLRWLRAAIVAGSAEDALRAIGEDRRRWQIRTIRTAALLPWP